MNHSSTAAGSDPSGASGGAEPAEVQLRELARLAERTAEALAGDLRRVADRVIETFRAGGRLYFAGNGGSAADAQHLAAEYVVRFRRRRPPLPAVALTTDSSVLTAGSNDLGFDEVFARQVRGLCRRGDLLFLHSTSGESENLVRAAEAAREGGVVTVAFLARGGGRLRERVDVPLVVPTDVTARAQEIHLALGHVVCDLVDAAFAEATEEGASSNVVRLLEEGRMLEKSQTFLYRGLAGAAELEGRAEDAERMNELLADEQHHLSRLTARVLELGARPGDLTAAARPEVDLEGWREEARRRETEEVRWYEAALEAELDEATRRVLEEILESERHHREELGGKWMPA